MEDDQNQEANSPAEHSMGSSEVSSEVSPEISPDDTASPSGVGGRRPTPVVAPVAASSTQAPVASVKVAERVPEKAPEKALERAPEAKADKVDRVEKTEKTERVEKKRVKTVVGGQPNIVRRIRIERMMSKAELARSANLSVLTIDRVEKGFGCRVDTKRKILEALGLSLADRVRIFGEEE